MALTQQQIAHKLVQHDAEIIEIYDQLAEIRRVQDDQGATLGSHTQLLNAHTGMLEEILRRLPEQEDKIGQQTVLLNEVLRRLPG